jgi:Tol biopolymer transport system component
MLYNFSNSISFRLYKTAQGKAKEGCSMNRRRARTATFYLIFGAFFFLRCGGDFPASTLTPTFTPTSTFTATPTLTPTSTVTLAPGLTPTVTSTDVGGGGLIVYGVDNGQGTDIYLYDMAAKREIPLVVDDPAVFKYAFAWSPDGRQIAYQAGFQPPDNRLMIVDVETGKTRTLAYSASYRNWFPAWSPDGKRIAFASDRDQAGNEFRIYAMNVDGTDIVRLTDFKSAAPHWSPDGKRIAFQSDRDGNVEIYAINSDGTDPVRLTNTPANDYEPVWSPDGTKLLFTTERDGNEEVYVMNSDGSDPVNLTNNGGQDVAGSWSPDGRLIVFGSDRSGPFLAYLISASGGEASLVPTHKNASPPVWSVGFA